MNIRLIKASCEYKEKITEMIKEWKQDIEVNHTNSSPAAIFRYDVNDFDYYMTHLEIKEYDGKFIPDSTFFCLDTDRDRLVGAVNIRHFLNDRTYLTAGHIGDGIRPSERRKGYATAMIGLALEECRKLGINKVLMTCDKTNIGSAKSIINNGGVLESELETDGETVQRYWITLFEETIESKRLTLRRVIPMDYKEMAAWTLDSRVYRYLLGNPCVRPEDALNLLRKNDPNSMTKYLMIIHSKEDGHAIGLVAAIYKPEDDMWEISYSERYDDWGKGYITEAASSLMAYLEKKIGPVVFCGECANENIGSAKVLQKLGMVFDHSSSYTKHDGSKTYASSVYIKK